MTTTAQRRLNQLTQQTLPGSLPCPMESLAEERLNPSFSVDELKHFLNGGKENTELKEKIMQQLERDPAWKLSDLPNLSLGEVRERTLKKAKSLITYLSSEPMNDFLLRMQVISYTDPGFYTRFGVHSGLFLGAIKGQATANQLKYWIDKGALTLQGVIGCFAMTELGHGSNVASLETTATFDEVSDEFIIHTPTLTATKWWIGGAAQTATHTTAYARLLINGKDHGVKTFVVPLRDPTDFSLKPGITIGDCGKKMGRDGIDNGYIQFTHVRIPRQYMLMKHTQVTRDGEVFDPPLAQLAYGALIYGRVTMVTDAATFSSKALTIALRYSAIRRQFSASSSGPETKLLDYPIHQHRLIPLLAQTMAFHATGRAVMDMYKELQHAIDSLNPESDDLPKVIETLKEVHATSAGLKAFSTWGALDLIEKCRQTLGGHGYSSYTGLASMYQDFAVQCTWEGDNTILTLQLGRYLISSYRSFLKKGSDPKNLAPGIRYLVKAEATTPSPAKNLEELTNIGNLVQGWDRVSAISVKQAATAFQAALESGLKTEAAHEKCSVQRLKAAKIHSHGYTLKMFAEGVKLAPANLKPILTLLCQLHGCKITTEFSGQFLAANYYTADQIDQLEAHCTYLCSEIRPDVINLVDSFGFSDYIINSPLGRKDGDIYRAYFNLVQQNNPLQERPPYFNNVIQPLLNAKYTSNTDLKLEIDENEAE